MMSDLEKIINLIQLYIKKSKISRVLLLFKVRELTFYLELRKKIICFIFSTLFESVYDYIDT